MVRRDEIGDLARGFDSFLSKLRSIVVGLKESQAELRAIGARLKEASEETLEAILGISEAVDGARENSKTQARSIEESSTAVTQIATSIDSLDRLVANQSSSVT